MTANPVPKIYGTFMSEGKENRYIRGSVRVTSVMEIANVCTN
jgi:hypothetical protein